MESSQGENFNEILGFLIDTIFMFGERGQHQLVGFDVGVKLCSSSRQLALSFVRDISHTRASLVKRKEARPIIKYALLSPCTIYMMSVY
jgi:hypothetical protein